MERNQMIGYEIGECLLGRVLAATTERGVCAILLGDEASRLAEDLRARFPLAELIPGGVAAEHFAKVVELIASPRDGLDLPLDPLGNEQQKRVWEALRRIPAGAVETYAAVARPVGVTAKEVGEACAANAIAVAIPCHRVVRSDGTLAGYRWGAKRKLALLKLEGARLGPTQDLFDSAVH